MVDYIAVIVAAIVSVVLGMIYYGPQAFGKLWMKLANVKKSSSKSKMKISMLLGLIQSIVIAWVLAIFIVDTADIWAAGRIALLIWVGFIVTTKAGVVLWEGKSWRLWLLNIGYDVISLVAMTLVLFYWPW
ncbi:DUF1761 domain-containing protein [Candidatus Woesearchaeota archaeon]|nr:DUF1761 domain-containing protein [Candidatus Woesearchaeota archaeon]